MLLAFCQRPSCRKSSALQGSFKDWHIADISSGRPEEQVRLAGQVLAVAGSSATWLGRCTKDLGRLNRRADNRVKAGVVHVLMALDRSLVHQRRLYTTPVESVSRLGRQFAEKLTLRAPVALSKRMDVINLSQKIRGASGERLLIQALQGARAARVLSSVTANNSFRTKGGKLGCRRSVGRSSPAQGKTSPNNSRWICRRWARSNEPRTGFSSNSTAAAAVVNRSNLSSLACSV